MSESFPDVAGLLAAYVELLVSDAVKALNSPETKDEAAHLALWMVESGAAGNCDDNLVNVAAAILDKSPRVVWRKLLEQVVSRSNVQGQKAA